LRPPNEANESAQLALLSWIPNPTPKALQASEELTETVKDRWGTVCDKAAPPTPVLWTFRYEPLGPSVPGWEVTGEPWPDPPDTVRSLPTPTELPPRSWARSSAARKATGRPACRRRSRPAGRRSGRSSRTYSTSPGSR
jgi:hypothetical protein